ncbi:cysteine hydrolase family protein [Microbacterium fluvii]|uniref:Cysteine hydrolase family protein n=1 Tax=Microbacterium fluvii TaxID=415215 RepID=A0ABW2HHA1_9MICO|nr:isochorismatase family cysteine hydrolase [Microbacterium fluvii]MCU4672797.1 cysteine hydrolase [Microbacterium fluvii]
MTLEEDLSTPATARSRWRVSAQGVDLRRPALAERAVRLECLPSPVTIDLARSALIVIDMQNDFCAPDGWLAGWGIDVSGSEGVVSALQPLLPAARAAGVPVVWVNWGARLDQANLPAGVRHSMDPFGDGRGIGAAGAHDSRAMTRGAWGAQLVDGLHAEPGDIWVDKHRLSGFWDTPLDSILRNLRVDTLLFTGVNSDQCVFASLIDAAALGYDVVLVDQASGTTSPAYCHDATLYNTRQCYGFTIDAAQLLAGLSAQTVGER